MKFIMALCNLCVPALGSIDLEWPVSSHGGESITRKFSVVATGVGI